MSAAMLETTRNAVGTDCQGKDVAVRCWREAVAASGLADKELAADAGLTAPHYSKIANGAQGDLLGLAYRVGRVYPQLRSDFIARLAEAEAVDPRLDAIRDTFQAMYRLMRVLSAPVAVRRVR